MATAIVISGTVGVGKTAVATELHDLFAGRGERTAFIDIDTMCQAEPAPAADPYNDDLAFENLAAIWPNYQRRGTEFVVMARVVEGLDHRARYEAIFGPVTIVRLVAPSDVRRTRLLEREPEGPWRIWHLNRTDELAASLEALAVEDFVVVNDGRTAAETAAAIASALS